MMKVAPEGYKNRDGGSLDIQSIEEEVLQSKKKEAQPSGKHNLIRTPGKLVVTQELKKKNISLPSVFCIMNCKAVLFFVCCVATPKGRTPLCTVTILKLHSQSAVTFIMRVIFSAAIGD